MIKTSNHDNHKERKILYFKIENLVRKRKQMNGWFSGCVGERRYNATCTIHEKAGLQ